MSDHVLYLTEQDVVTLVSPSMAIEAVRARLLDKAAGSARNVAKSLGVWSAGSMHSLGSFSQATALAGFKTWVRTNNGGGSIFTLFDMSSGKLQAIIEARALGLLRTSAITGVATDLLAPAEATVGCLIGTGDQASMQLRALAAVRQFTEMRVYSPTQANREAFCRRHAGRYRFPLRPCNSLEQATHGARVVTTITRAEAPFIDASMLRECQLFNAVGAILPQAAEFHQDVFDHTGMIVVDDMDNARRGSRELRERFGERDEAWANVATLDQLLAAKHQRTANAPMTLFKGMGMGLSDLAVAGIVYARAIECGAGIRLPAQTRQNLLEADSLSPNATEKGC